jgi:hypothetical protein
MDPTHASHFPADHPAAGLADTQPDGPQPDDPLPDADEWRRVTDTRLHRPDIARLQEAARSSRDRIARRLAAAGLRPGVPGSGGPGVPDLDTRRDLDAAIDVDVETLERVDELHDRRMRSASPRERQHATTVLAEALHRIVDGYQVGDPPPSRVVRGLRRVDEGVRRAYAGVTVFHDQTPVVDWWERASRWVLLLLAGVGALLLAGGHPVEAAVVVVVRVVLAAVTAPPAPPASTWRRLIGYNPDWASSVCNHAGDALILAGLAAGLHGGGRPLWATLTMAAALFGLLATMSRVAAREQGLRLPRLWIERATKDIALTGSVLAAALTAGPRLGPAAASTLVAPAVVSALGVTELIRTAYYARRRRRLLSRASDAGGDDDLVPNAIVVTTGDAIVVNLRRAGGRPPIFPAGTGHGERHLRAVPATGDWAVD